MSVYSLIHGKRHPVIREQLDVLMPAGLYDRTCNAVLRVPHTTGVHGSLIGTAFDYALRWELQRRRPDALVEPWAAEAALMLAEVAWKRAGYARRPEEPRSVDPTQRGLGVVADDPLGRADLERRATSLRRLVERMRHRVRNARIFVSKHVKRRRPDTAWFLRLANHAVRMARLDPFYRAGYSGPELLVTDDESVLQEVVAMLAIVPWEEVSLGKPLLLNASFGDASRLVGGADCDLVNGDRLIDIKVVPQARVEREMVRQLIAYMFLAERATGANTLFPRFNQLCIYFARHGHLWHLDAQSIRGNPQFESARRTIFDYLERRDSRGPSAKFLELVRAVGPRTGGL